jgi:hypothetical protein
MKNLSKLFLIFLLGVSSNALYCQSETIVNKNTSPETAMSIEYDEVIRGVLTLNEEALWFRIKSKSRQEITVAFFEGCGNTYMSLYDRSGKEWLANESEGCDLNFMNRDNGDELLIKIHSNPKRKSDYEFGFKVDLTGDYSN